MLQDSQLLHFTQSYHRSSHTKEEDMRDSLYTGNLIPQLLFQRFLSTVIEEVDATDDPKLVALRPKHVLGRRTVGQRRDALEAIGRGIIIEQLVRYGPALNARGPVDESMIAGRCDGAHHNKSVRFGEIVYRAD